jgi:DNA-binding transcriptional ArsR family regulator
VPSVFDAVAEPARRRLLDLLLAAPRAVEELAAATGMSQPNTSGHLRVLREAGLVESRVAGRRRIYAIRPDGFAEVAQWLTPYALLWQRGRAGS